MYLDNARTNLYDDHLKSAAHVYQSSQYDAARLQYWLGRISAGVGQRLVQWGQRLQADPTSSAYWRTGRGKGQWSAQ